MCDLRRPPGDPISTARALVRSRYPRAIAAWLGGSAAAGRATPTSDLDVTVLLADATDVRDSEHGVHRESLTHDGWPVELFVHDDRSVRHFVAKDLARRRPTMARLVGEGVPLLGEPEEAAEVVGRLVRHCREVLAGGPPDLGPAELDARRYLLSDQLDDLAGGGPADEVAATAVSAWTAATELLLARHGRWWGSGKWLVRETGRLDADLGTTHAADLHAALAAAVATGQPNARRLIEECDDILDQSGGRLWGGYRATAELPPATTGG